VGVNIFNVEIYVENDNYFFLVGLKNEHRHKEVMVL
jgi:hypothetical protein